MGKGSRGLGKNQRGLPVGCWAMVGVYNNDSSSKENLNLLLRLTQVEANIDLKDRRFRFLKGVFKKMRMLGAPVTTPGNYRLHREFEV